MLEILPDNKCSIMCPKYPGFTLRSNGEFPWQRDSIINWDACKVCMKFVGIEPQSMGRICPCRFFKTKEKAIKQSYKALEEKGYL